MPRNRVTDEVRQPILHDVNEEAHDYQDNELEEMTCCNPTRSWYRFLALFFMCLVGFGMHHLTVLINFQLKSTVKVPDVSGKKPRPHTTAQKELQIDNTKEIT